MQNAKTQSAINMKKNWSEIERHWLKLQGMIAFDLTVPCIVIDQRDELMETTLANLSNHLRVSTALATPQMKGYMSLAKKVGPEKAMQAMLEAMDQETEEFVALYNEATTDIARDCYATIDDLVDAINTARKGFNTNPKKILVIQMNNKYADILLVAPPMEEWSDDRYLDD